MEALASEFGYYSAPPPPPPPSSIKNPDNFAVEDLLDFSHDDGASDQLATDSFTSTPPLDTSHSSDNNHHPHFTSPSHFSDSHFSGDLCLPYEDSAELEWLSNFVEESFSTEDIQKLQLISGMSALKTRPDDYSEPRYYPLGPTCTVASPSPSLTFSSEQPVPGKARSKRSRAAPGNWATCLRLLNPTQPDTPAIAKPDPKKKGESGVGLGMGLGHDGGEVRRCLHCATDKTPQWRTGPMGPKTLCNACGVRYKSGRLVPEYRPAASPTFMLAKHSNSHRKVMELRRQKELQRQQQLQQQYHHQHHQHHPQQLIHNPNGMMFDQANSDDYLIHQHIGPDFRQLI